MDYEFTCNTGFDIIVYKDDEFYSLSNQEELDEVLENEILSETDIASLFNRYNK